MEAAKSGRGMRQDKREEDVSELKLLPGEVGEEHVERGLSMCEDGPWDKGDRRGLVC